MNRNRNNNHQSSTDPTRRCAHLNSSIDYNCPNPPCSTPENELEQPQQQYVSVRDIIQRYNNVATIDGGPNPRPHSQHALRSTVPQARPYIHHGLRSSRCTSQPNIRQFVTQLPEQECAASVNNSPLHCCGRDNQEIADLITSSPISSTIDSKLEWANSCDNCNDPSSSSYKNNKTLTRRTDEQSLRPALDFGRLQPGVCYQSTTSIIKTYDGLRIIIDIKSDQALANTQTAQ